MSSLKPLFLMPLTLLALSANAVPGAPLVLDDPHLAIVPRTEDETARIASVTAPTRDFTAQLPQKTLCSRRRCLVFRRW